MSSLTPPRDDDSSPVVLVAHPIDPAVETQVSAAGFETLQLPADPPVAALADLPKAVAVVVVSGDVAAAEPWCTILARFGKVARPGLLMVLDDATEVGRHTGLLGSDASDFVVRPSDPGEIRARVGRLVCRVSDRGARFLRSAGLELDRERRVASIDGTVLELTPKELALLERVMLDPGAVVTRDELLEQVWGTSHDPGTNVVDVHLAHLRKKLRDSGAPVRIVTMRGIGVRLVVDASATAFRPALESAPDPTVVVDRDGTIAFANSKVTDLLGYALDEILEQPIEILVPEHLRRAHSDHREGYGRAPAARPMGAGDQLAALRKDGSTVPVDISLSPLEGSDGQLTVAALRSVEDRVARESERRLELATRVGTAAHDFNNMLTTIAGFVEFLRIEGTERPETFAHIAEAIQGARALSRELMDSTRRHARPHGRACAGGVLQRLEASLHGACGEAVELVCETSPDLPAVTASEGEITQVLLNATLNARDAIGDGGGTIRIEITPERIDGDSPVALEGHYVRIRVTDDGAGMTPDQLDAAFEPYFTTKPSGNGLGLPGLRDMVEAKGGLVQLDSTLGKGTTIAVYLPVAEGVG